MIIAMIVSVQIAVTVAYGKRLQAMKSAAFVVETNGSWKLELPLLGTEGTEGTVGTEGAVGAEAAVACYA